jgi:starch synthase
MEIAIVAAEMGPLAKAGGLADVIGALPQALKRAGANPAVVLPAYQCVLDQTETAVFAEGCELVLGASVEPYRVLRARADHDVPLYLIDHPGFFGRDGIYGDATGVYPDNHRRFVFFGRAAAALAGQSLGPDVLHTHDWHGATAAVVARADPALRTRLAHTVSAFTIHNIAFQGNFARDDFALLGLDSSWYSTANLEFFGQVNLMKGAIVLADGVSTVSPTYAHEVASDAELGFGLDGVLRDQGDHFIGILNGADYEEWDPAKDPHISTHYSAARRIGKKACLYDLREELHLPHRLAVPVIGMVTRMVWQKGLDLLAAALDRVLTMDLQLVMVASGDPPLEQQFREAAQRHPDRLRIVSGFDNGLAHRVQAGSDMFLMPSRYEPCGLTQMYALKYGSAPIVRATGGLNDTVVEFDRAAGTGNGFRFDAYEADALVDAVARATAVFQEPRKWARLMQNCFAADFSWDRAAHTYLAWFERLRAERRAMDG